MSDSAGLRHKLRSAEDLQSVVRTMKAVAASSIEQYERAVRALSGYASAVELGLGACLRQRESDASVRSSARANELCAVVFGSDQGLVGKFNETVADCAVEKLGSLRDTARVWSVGERVHACLVDRGIEPVGRLAVPSSVAGIGALVGEILLECMTEPIAGLGELYLFHNQPLAGADYEPHERRLLPLDAAWQGSLRALPWPTRTTPQVLGADSTTLRAFVHEHLFISLFRTSAESLASENASRLAAMERADKNIDELLVTLHETFHRQRQSGIDAELFDLISGFELTQGRG